MIKIGFIGLGHMGLPMAINLVKAGFDVKGFDLQKEAVQAFVEAGGQASKHLQDTIEQREYIITMLQTGNQVLDVCLGEQGLYQGILKHHGLHIDCSTIDVASARKLHEAAAEKNILSLDSPVSGGVAKAKTASLTFMVGGRDYDLKKAEPILAAMGSKIIHAGGAGSGQAAKLCNNMILGISMLAVSEAFTLGESLGLNPKKLHEVISNASGQCWVTDNYLPVPDVLPNVPANHDYQPGFSVAMMLKDLILSQKTALESEVFSPMGDRATELYQLFADEGFSQLDFSAIIQLIQSKRR